MVNYPLDALQMTAVWRQLTPIAGWGFGSEMMMTSREGRLASPGGIV
jgi:hypothetical protein